MEESLLKENGEAVCVCVCGVSLVINDKIRSPNGPV